MVKIYKMFWSHIGKIYSLIQEQKVETIKGKRCCLVQQDMLIKTSQYIHITVNGYLTL
jgi:hypothetical protein